MYKELIHVSREEREGQALRTLVTTFENVNIFFHLRTFPQEKLRVEITSTRRCNILLSYRIRGGIRITRIWL